MSRLLPSVAILVVIATGCSNSPVTEQTASTAPPAPPAPSSTATSEAPAPSGDTAPSAAPETDPTTTTATAAPAVVVDGPPAPDFALALDDGRGFILSEEQKPVYMVFWAEW